MRLAFLCALVGGPLLLGGGGPARAQLVAAPESLAVALRQREEVTAAVALVNGGSSPVRYCLDFDRPLQRRPDDIRGGSTCRPPGGRLFQLNQIYGLSLAMTPDGRLFIAEDTPFGYTRELTADLQLVRYFRHPNVAELTPFAYTLGVTYNEDTGTLWWTNVEESAGVLRRVLLLEGDLDGVPTGRRIEIPVPLGDYAAGAAYDAALKRYYYVDETNGTLGAIDTAGVVQPGYPLRLEHRPDAHLGNGVDVHGGSGGDPAAVRIEVPVAFLPGETYYSRAVVTDPEGRDLGPGSETPFPPFDPPFGGVDSNALRSRLDPNGVMYVGYGSFDSLGVAAIRPAPLSPTWLGLSAWNGWVEPGAQAEVVLTFRAGERAPGVYHAVLAVEDTTGAVLAQVPLALEVLPGTSAEEPGPDAPGVRLVVVPNPSAGEAQATLTLSAAARVRVAVYDALGRAVAVLHDGPLGAGEHAFGLDGSALRPGAYLLRAVAGGRAAARVVTLTR